METAAWVGAIATAVYSITFLVTAVYLVRQVREARLLREASVLKDVYDYVIRTHADRAVVYENEESIRGIESLEDLWTFEAQNPSVARAIHSVANCYHYQGFLLKHNILTSREAVLEEGGRTVLRVYGIIGPIVALQRDSQGSKAYKQHFDFLAEQAHQFLNAPR